MLAAIKKQCEDAVNHSGSTRAKRRPRSFPRGIIRSGAAARERLCAMRARSRTDEHPQGGERRDDFSIFAMPGGRKRWLPHFAARSGRAIRCSKLWQRLGSFRRLTSNSWHSYSGRIFPNLPPAEQAVLDDVIAAYLALQDERAEQGWRRARRLQLAHRARHGDRLSPWLTIRLLIAGV